MAKDRSESERKEKKEKKEREKHSHSEENGVVKKSKRDKKDKKLRDESATSPELVQTLVSSLEKKKSKKSDGAAEMDIDVASEADEAGANGKLKKERLVGAMVPFANPLADEKTMRKVLKTVKKAAKHKMLKRGVKEVVKSLRKSTNPSATSSSSSSSSHPAPFVVILAADISPFDVISHIPVLCEDHAVPYLYVPSRAELGAAGSTKRPTSVVMITPTVPKNAAAKASAKDKGGSKAEDVDKAEDWPQLYAELVKVVEKAGRSVKV